VSGEFEEPLDGEREFDGCGDGGATREWIKEDEQGSHFRMPGLGFDQRTDFSFYKGGKYLFLYF